MTLSNIIMLLSSGFEVDTPDIIISTTDNFEMLEITWDFRRLNHAIERIISIEDLEDDKIEEVLTFHTCEVKETLRSWLECLKEYTAIQQEFRGF